MHAYTFRAENQFLYTEFRSSTDPNARGDMVGMIQPFLDAGIDGIKRSLDPGDVGAQGPSTLPPTLLHAIDELEADPVIAGVLDTAGTGVASYFAGIKRDEFFAYHGTVAPWEIDQYLTAF